MLNSHLIEYMGAIHRQKRSGVLTVIGPGYRLRFCCEGGDPVAIDLGADKELILADEMAAQHKIDATGHQSLVDQYQAGVGTVTDLARTANLASEDEIASATRGVVESILLRCFGTMHYEASFEENETVDGFDFALSAIRLRIAMPQLLSTVQPRVQEHERIFAVVVPNAVFALDENTHGSVQLSEQEKKALNFVDGKLTVEEIAMVCRDSTANLARCLFGLVDKGLVRQIHVAIIQTAPEIPQSARRSSAEGYLSQSPSSASPLMGKGLRLVLLVVVVLVVLIVFGIVQIQRGHEGRSQVLTGVKASILSKMWNEAAQQVETARREAGNDSDAIRAAELLASFFSKELTNEQQAIATLIDKGLFDEARRRIERLPMDASATELVQRLKQSEETASERLTTLKDRIDRALKGGRTADAMDEVRAAEKYEQPELLKSINTWRDLQLTEAAQADVLYGERCSLLKRVEGASPNEIQTQRIQTIRQDAGRQRQGLATLIAELGKRSLSGAYAEVTNIWERERISEQAHSSDLADEAARVHQDNDKMKNTLSDMQATALIAVREGDDPAHLRTTSQQVTAVLAKLPQASNAASLKIIAQLLGEVASMIHADNVSEELRALHGWLAEHQPMADTTAAIKVRVARLEGVERAAGETLERARGFTRHDNWEQAQSVLEDLCSRKEWKKTKAYAAAIVERNAAIHLAQKRKVWRQDLDKALEKGDSEQALIIARKMGLKYLPLRIETIPTGAEIWSEGKQIGTSPMTVDVPAAERAGLRFELRRNGFISAHAEALSAEAGWRLLRRLERQPADRQELGLSLTIRPTVAEGKVFTGNRQLLVAVAPGSRVARWALDAGSADLSQPLYAAPVFVDTMAWLSTREGLALGVSSDTGKANVRIPLIGRTDLALAIHASAFVIGRRFVISAGQEGILRAVDMGDATSTWIGQAGAPFASAPLRTADDALLIVRQDGRCERYNPDDGSISASGEIKAPVVGAWADAGVINAYAGGWLWSWNGATLTKSELPAQALAGSDGVFVAGDNHVFLRGDQGWIDVGRIEGAVTATPVRWSGHAVISIGKRLTVLGPVPFSVEMSADILDPVVLGDHLVVPCADGVVVTYKL